MITAYGTIKMLLASKETIRKYLCVYLRLLSSPTDCEVQDVITWRNAD